MSFDKMFTYLQTDIYATTTDVTKNQPTTTEPATNTSGITENDIWPPADLELGENSSSSNSDDSLDTSTDSSNSMCSSLSGSLDEDTINIFSLLCIANDKVKKSNNHLRKFILNKQCLNNIISYIESNIYI